MSGEATHTSTWQRTVPAWLLFFLFLPAARAKDTTWIELRDLNLDTLTAAPTTAERLAKATALLVPASQLHANGPDWDMDVRPWIEVKVQGGVGSEPFCQPLDNLDQLFYGQSELAGDTCSAFLVAPDLVITAGHCIDSSDCTDKYAVFDFSDEGDAPPSGQVHLAGDRVLQCEEVLFDSNPGPATGLPTSPRSLDWALLRLAGAIDLAERTPLALDRFTTIQPEDTMLVMGYPNGLSLKAEVANHAGSASVIAAHALTGNSGSPIFNLETGKASQILTGAGPGWVIQQTSPPCHDPCFECDGEHAGGDVSSLFVSPDLPVLGLQIDAGGGGSLVQHYGPPTIGSDFDSWSVTVRVDDPLEPLSEVSWALLEESNPSGPPTFDVLAGPTSGSLAAGESETITLRPADTAVAVPGVVEAILPLFDYSFGTRDPITHQIHVGVDGYTVFPSDDLVGEGLGVPDGERQEFNLANRWIVGQNVRMSWNADWITIDGSGSPRTVTLPGKYSGAPQPIPIVVVDGAGLGLAPDVYEDRLQFESLDSGVPGETLDIAVKLDHCREIYAKDGLPDFVTLDPDDPLELRTKLWPNSVVNSPLLTIKDLDLISELYTTNPTFEEQPYSLTLIAPDGTPVLFKDFNNELQGQTIFDQDNLEYQPPTGNLDAFDDSLSAGEWALKLVLSDEATAPVTFRLDRLEIRLQHNTGSYN
jgi:Trypsin-like peptidase domain